MAHLAFRGHIPGDLLYDTEYDMWVRWCNAGGDEVLIGATSFGLFLAGEIIAFTAKPQGSDCQIGRGIGTVESAKTVLAVHAPVSIVLLQANEEIETTPAILGRDPYVDGWLVRGRATAWAHEREHLVDASAYRAHVLRVEPGAEFL